MLPPLCPKLRRKTKFFEINEKGKEEQPKDSLVTDSSPINDDTHNKSSNCLLDSETLNTLSYTLKKKRNKQRAINNWERIVQKLLEMNKVMCLDEYTEAVGTVTLGKTDIVPSAKTALPTWVLHNIF